MIGGWRLNRIGGATASKSKPEAVLRRSPCCRTIGPYGGEQQCSTADSWLQDDPKTAGGQVHTMGFQFKVGNPPPRAAFVLSSCRTPRDVITGLQAALASAAAGDVIEIVLDPPSREVRDLSIPRAFRVLSGLVSQAPGGADVVVHVSNEAILAEFERYLPIAPDHARRFEMGRFVVEFVIRDVMDLKADAVVNASNPTLTLGGGVSGAIREKARDSLQAELHRIAARHRLVDGDVVATESFGLPNAKRIFHAATATDDPRAITRAIGNLLALADSEGLASLAMPALGTGTGRLPSREFGRLLHEVARSHVDHHPSGSVRRLAVAAWTRNALLELVKGWEASSPGV